MSSTARTDPAAVRSNSAPWLIDSAGNALTAMEMASTA